MKEMAKFLVIWHINPLAPLPTDPNESIQFNEMMFAQMDRLLQSGEAQEFGFFSNGTSGYAITGGEAHDEMGRAFGFYPWLISEVHEIVPYETGKEVMRAVLKAEAEQMQAMKR
jgi:hypothetical protein